jgi:hypothetical protein
MYRKALTRLRLSSHNLKIEYGRHDSNRIDRHVRVCVYCDKHDIEDEYHFTLVCTLYNDFEEKTHIIVLYKTNPSIFKFLQLMNDYNTTVQKQLALFVYEPSNVRHSQLRQ